MKKISYALAVLLVSCAPIQAQTTLTGTWQAAVSGTTWTLMLRTSGSVVTGSVSACGSARVSGIYDGTVQGDTLTFKCTSSEGDRTVAFRGQVSGDSILFTREAQARKGGIPFFHSDKMFGPEAPQQFTVRRVAAASAGAGAALTDTGDHVRTASAVAGVVYYQEGAALRPLSKAVVGVSAAAPATAEIDGSTAPIRFTSSPTPVFRVCGVDPARYKLYTLKSESDSRVLETRKSSGSGLPAPVMTEREVATAITSAEGNCFSITPKVALNRGEYGIHPIDSNDVFDFGVDSAATR